MALDEHLKTMRDEAKHSGLKKGCYLAWIKVFAFNLRDVFKDEVNNNLLKCGSYFDIDEEVLKERMGEIWKTLKILQPKLLLKSVNAMFEKLLLQRNSHRYRELFENEKLYMDFDVYMSNFLTGALDRKVFYEIEKSAQPEVMKIFHPYLEKLSNSPETIRSMTLTLIRILSL